MNPIDYLAARYEPDLNSGYGKCACGLSRRAHRASWEAHRGPIPSGLYVLHRCDTPLCINPAHLFLGTHEDNIADMHAKGRGNKGGSRAFAFRTHCAKGHELKPENLAPGARGTKLCRECARVKNRAFKRKMRLAAKADHTPGMPSFPSQEEG